MILYYKAFSIMNYLFFFTPVMIKYMKIESQYNGTLKRTLFYLFLGTLLC